MSQPNYDSEVREARSKGWSDEGNNGVLSPRKKKIAKAMNLKQLSHKFKKHAQTWESAKSFKHSNKPF